MNEILNERLEQVINLIPQYSWSLMTEEQRDDLMSGIVVPRYMATTADGTKLTPSTWGAILGASAASVRNRVLRLKASQTQPDPSSSSSLTKNEQAGIRSVKSTLLRKEGAAEALIESLPLEARVEMAKALSASTKSAPISEKRRKDSEAANAPLDRAVNSFHAQIGTVALIDRATGEINDAVSGSGLNDDALEQIEAAGGRLMAAIEFAKAMRGGVAQ